ncbi:MAG: hypothetical protein M0Q38_17040 [Bacteroidales bacterium]|nr:hypothetical protein [Bacteroidales bacterium]
MKSKFTFFKFISFALLLALIVIVVVSCRKKDTEYNPVPPGPTPPPATPDAFSNRPLNMLSEYEKSHHLAFPGHLIHQLGSGLVGGEASGSVTWDILKGIGDIVKDVYDYKSGKKKDNTFQQLQSGMNSIQSQITNMESTNFTMITQLGIQIDDLGSNFSTGAMSPLIYNVETEMGVNNNLQLGYYLNIGNQWEQDSTNSTNIYLMNTAKGEALAYAQGTLAASASSTGMLYTLTGFNTQMIQPLAGSANPVKAYAKTVVDALKVGAVARVLDANQALQAYQLVEQYFMTIINYEFQAATVYLNACNMVDSTGQNKMDSIFIAGTFAPQIISHAKIFLQVVDFLVVNANEYRDEARFERDMLFEDQGIAPDTIFGPVFARAQFLANLLCAAVGKPYPVMCGTVLTPYTYGVNPPGPMTFQIGGNPVTTTYDTTLQSQLAYTQWTRSGNTCISSPDNSWFINRLGTIGVADQGYDAQTYSISIPGARWSPIQTPSGHVTPQYFNPANLTYSPVKDSVHTILFLYFAANWQWGEMYIDHGPSTTASGPTYFDFYFYNTKMTQSLYPLLKTPVEGYGPTYPMSYPMGQFSNLSSTIRKLGWSGTMLQTSYLYTIANGHYVDIQTGPNVLTNGTVQAWAFYNVEYTMKGTGTTFITVNIGTSDVKKTYNFAVEPWYHIGSELTQTKWTGPVNVVNSEFKGPPLATNTNYQMGIQFFYQTEKVPENSPPGTISLTTSYQVVYSGYYSMPN